MSRADRRTWCAIALAGSALACAGNPAPRGTLKPAQGMPSDPYGAWILVALPDRTEIGGEFLAVERDSVFVLRMDGEVQAFAQTHVSRAVIAYYDSEWQKLRFWTFPGSLMTVSNGFLLALTFPIFNIVGSIAAANQSKAPLVRIERHEEWPAARMYARFPRGLPPGMPRRMAWRPGSP